MIRQIKLTEIECFLPECRRSGLTFCRNTEMFGLFAGDKLVCFGGVLRYRRKAVIKNLFTPVAERGNGFFKKLLNYLLKMIETENIKTVEATCTMMSLREFIKRGFVEVKQYKQYTKVRYENLS